MRENDIEGCEGTNSSPSVRSSAPDGSSVGLPLAVADSKRPQPHHRRGGAHHLPEEHGVGRTNIAREGFRGYDRRNGSHPSPTDNHTTTKVNL
ncbi:hypothetical protein [Haladaptatus caseinilyticus]|uniref:hypothetical protein n=1 Tax=Haladaptatus caseinilyticus TaxID=2993314 RepID=UPI00224A692D|nr:hypothetical protein [Haladaptatus caseinilyticus]